MVPPARTRKHEVKVTETWEDALSRIITDSRIVLFNDEVSPMFVKAAVRHLLYLAAKSKEPITVIINSPGGEVYAGLLLFDTIRSLNSQGIPVDVEVRGLAASMGAILLQAGRKRLCTKYTRFLIHEVSSVSWGKCCLPNSTEFLTPTGWKTIEEYHKNDVIAMYNPDIDIFQWTVPEKVFVYDSSPTEFLNLIGRKFSMRVTTNHRIFGFDRCGKCTAPYRFVIGHNKDILVPVAANGFHESPFKISDNMIQLLAWVASEGHFSKDGRIEIYQGDKYPDRLRAIQSLLKSNSIPNKMDLKSVNGDMNHYRFRIPARYTEPIKRLMANKNDYSNMLKLSKTQSRLFIDTFALGDGHTEDGYTNISQSTQHRADMLQIIALRAGYSALVRPNLMVPGNFSIRLSDTRCSSLQYMNPKFEISSEPVWCFKVSTGAFLVRQNGSPFITGNSEQEEQVKELTKLNSMLKDILAERTGKTADEIEKVWHKTDYWMSSKEALKFGLIDEIV